MNITSCRTCGDRVWWAQLPNGKKIPVNVWTSRVGKIVVLDPDSPTPLVRMLVKDEAVEEDARRYVSHFTTCRRKVKK